MGVEAGLAFNPPTPISAIRPYLDACDLVLTMSVMPGFGGQQFDTVALDKLRELSKLVGADVILEVDGGVNEQTIGACAAAGAHSLIAGSAIVTQRDYWQALTTLNQMARDARPR
jgi:ribulose-phosphate 3-epimerase